MAGAKSTAAKAAAALMAQSYRTGPSNRMRCNSRTTWNHGNLEGYVLSSLPDGWQVFGPGEPVAEPGGPTQYPPGPDDQHPSRSTGEAELRSFFVARGVTEENIPSDLMDRINGHCETVAASLSNHVLAELRNGTPPDVALRAGTAAMLSALESGSTAEQIALLFGTYIQTDLSPKRRPEAQARAAASKHSEVVDSHRWMWNITAIDDALPSRDGPHSFLRAMLAGATVELPQTLRHLAEHAGVDRFAVPLYVLNYIWDGCELTPKQMREEKHETACYSIHAVGLVYDLPSKTVSIADPNGPVMQGGGMEFVHIPYTKLPKGCKPSTAFSQFDRDQLQLADDVKQPGPVKKKRKKAR